MSKISNPHGYIIKGYIEKRDPYAHKGDFGRVLIVAGSLNMSGAAVLACRAALKTGSGLVYSCVHAELSHIIQITVPEVVMCHYEAFNAPKDFSKYDSIAVGPGLVDGFEERSILYNIIDYAECPVVIDADGLNLIAKGHRLSKLKKRAEKGLITVITPHMGEAFRLLKSRLSLLSEARAKKYEKYSEEKTPRKLTIFKGIDEEAEEKNERLLKEIFNGMSRQEITSMLYEETGATIVLKGHETIVYDAASGETYINETGNPGMATAGSGDVLTGIIASLLGQKINHAVETGTFLHGLAGDIAAGKYSEYSLTASDIVDNISSAFLEIMED